MQKSRQAEGLRKRSARGRNGLQRRGPKPRGFLPFVQKRPRRAQPRARFPCTWAQPGGPEALCAAVPGPQSAAKAGSQAARNRCKAPSGPHSSLGRTRPDTASALPGSFCLPGLPGGFGRVGSGRVFSRGGTYRPPSLSAAPAGFSPRITLPAPNSPPPQAGREAASRPWRQQPLPSCLLLTSHRSDPAR